VDDGYACPFKPAKRLSYAQRMGVQALVIRRHDIRHEAVVDFINKLMLGMLGSQ
jgi:hypothetical protein